MWNARKPRSSSLSGGSGQARSLESCGGGLAGCDLQQVLEQLSPGLPADGMVNGQAGDLACLGSTEGPPRPCLVMWHAAATEAALRGLREQDAVGMVKESTSAGKQGLRLLISGSDSLNLSGRATLRAAREYMAGLGFSSPAPPHIHSPHQCEEPNTPLSLWFLFQCPSWFPLMEA